MSEYIAPKVSRLFCPECPFYNKSLDVGARAIRASGIVSGTCEGKYDAADSGFTLGADRSGGPVAVYYWPGVELCGIKGLEKAGRNVYQNSKPEKFPK